MTALHLQSKATADNSGWLLLTSFGTLVYYDHEAREFRHGDPDKAPLNARLVEDEEGIILKLIDDLPEVVEKFDYSNRQIGRGWFGLRRDGKFLSAQPNGQLQVTRDDWLAWERFEAITFESLPGRFWFPASAKGGTELMLEALRGRVGSCIDDIDLRLNKPDDFANDGRPLAIWIHNGADDPIYNWLWDDQAVARVERLIFVSNWQRQRFADHFRLPLEKCSVLRNAIDAGAIGCQWRGGRPWRARCCYISAPYRGLDLMLDAWEELNPRNAELHVWSSVRLWGPNWEDGAGSRHLFARANDTRNVIYHGIAPNEEIRAALREMHFMTMPTSVPESFCISVAEAMASGCRVIAPSLGALPETAAGFARMYPYTSSRNEHKQLFMQALLEELESPWEGQIDLANAAHAYCKEAYGWERRAEQWRRLIKTLTRRGAKDASSNEKELAPAQALQPIK